MSTKIDKINFDGLPNLLIYTILEFISAIDVGRNICHGSDSVDSAKKEIALWFGEQNSTIPYKMVTDSWVYE